MRRAAPFPELFLLSLAVILLEVSYTRIFSFKLVYYFTYLIIGIALLGLGAAGVLAVLLGRSPRAPAARLVPLCALGAAAAILVGYLVIATVQLNTLTLVASLVQRQPLGVLVEGTKLAFICLTLFTPFLAAGLAIATILANDPERLARLYAVDLLGAGLGCALCVPLLGSLSPPGTVLVAGALVALAGLLAATSHMQRLAAVALVLVLAAGAAFPDRLPDPVPDRAKNMSPQQTRGANVLFSRWSPVFRVDVISSPFPHQMGRRLLLHDGLLGSLLMRFDGNLASLDAYEHDARAYPFDVLAPAPRVAIIGAAGGNEILAALYFGARHVTAVELNPVTVRLLRTDFADYTGHLATDKRVTLVNDEGRSFLARHDTHYDLIWFVAPDSYAAMNAATSGAYVLSESYLYTREMIGLSLSHLTDEGVICAQFGEFAGTPNRTVRYLSTARDAFQRLGIPDFDRHVLVSSSPSYQIEAFTILIRKTPFGADELARFRTRAATVEGSRVHFPAGGEGANEAIATVVAASPEALAAWYERYPYDVHPVTDDAPFFWHFARLRDVLAGSSPSPIYNWEQGLGERLLLVLLVMVTGFAAVVLLAPFVLVRPLWQTLPHKLRLSVFFAAIGAGFMFLEVTLIQRLTLFLGYPTHSLSVTLFALLVSTGVGSALSTRYPRRALVLLGVGLAALVLFYRYGLPPVVAATIGWPFAVRVGLAVALLAPLGLCLGAFLPLGMRTATALTPHRSAIVAWGWAVNGFAAVVSSVLATILSMTFGFNAVMLAALAVYALGIAALPAIPE